MAGVLSFPFRLDPTGHAATVQPGSDVEVDEALAVLMLTTLGERPMAPRFGIPDPGFAGLAASDLQVGIDQFGPRGINIASLTITPVTQEKSEASVAWERTGETGKDTPT